MKPFLIIQLRPEDAVSNKEFESILKFGELPSEEAVRLRIEESGIPEHIDPRSYAGIIVGGSPFDITTPAAEKSDVQNKIEADFKHLLKIVIEADIPFLGCCSGNGLLGNYCGAPLSKKFAEPVGGVDIRLTDEGIKDPLLSGLPRTFRALVGHKEACDQVPTDAILLASSKTCPVQMFKICRNIYATQFHPENDAEDFKLKIQTYKNHGYFPAEDAKKLFEAIENESTPFANEILRRFVSRYRSGS